MSTPANLFTPIRIGAVEAPNRIFMAPLTRCRAAAGNVPVELNALYYTQRATAGLIITEATSVSPRGFGYPNTPGIFTEAQPVRTARPAVRRRRCRAGLETQKFMVGVRVA